MKKYLTLFLCCCCWLTISLQAQQLTNARFQTQGDQIVVTYDLLNAQQGQQFEVSLLYSTDGGRTWQTPQSTNGDIGSRQSGGTNKRIVWQVLKDLPNGLHTSIGFKVKATTNIMGATTTASKPPERTETRKAYEPEMVFIKGGTFEMGSNDGESDEKPVHSVSVDGFYMGIYETTLAQFKAFIDDSGYQTDAEKRTDGYGSYVYENGNWSKKDGINWRHDAEGKLQSNDQHPVIHVSWNDAMEYCKWLSRKTGKTYTLPTEAQWEYAAGNGSRHTKYAWGNGNPTQSKGGNVADETGASKFNWAKNESNIFVGYTDGYAATAPVGQFGANDFGLYDMTGNVWEWCRDWYASDYYGKSPSRNPENTTAATYRVLRGGAWNDYPQSSRVAARNRDAPANRLNAYGFRLAVASQF